MSADRDILEREGRIWLRNALNGKDLADFDALLNTGSKPGQRLSIAESGSGLRSALGPKSRLSRSVQTVLPGARPVRMVSFNKTPEQNWGVPWHQDRIIAVKEKQDVSDFAGWSCKGGQWHCEPPVELPERMIFVRVHLDDTDTENGCLEIALRSHGRGGISAKDAVAQADTFETEVCRARRGDVLILKMLLLHRSLPAIEPTSRRTFRMDYSVDTLPTPLRWAL